MVANKYRWDFIGLSTDEKPTPANSEKVVDGSTYYCSDTSKLYVFCKDTWYEKTGTGGGGGGTTDFNDLDNRPKYNGTAMTGDTDIPQAPSVVQTTGSSTTDVMSQNAATGLIYKDTTYQGKIQIGKNASNNANYSLAIGENSYTGRANAVVIGKYASTGSYSGENGVAIGNYAKAYNDNAIAIGGSYSSNESTGVESQGGVAIGYLANISGNNKINSVAIGSYSQPTRAGEFHVGLRTGAAYGFNNTIYRVIGGVHDGQDAHDAVTVEQVNNVIDAINTALNVSIPHIGANS